MPEQQADQTRSAQRTSRRASSRWLIAAVVATVLSGALLAAAFAGLQQYPEVDESSTTISEIPDRVSPLVVAVARTPGGPGEWANWARVIKYISEGLQRPVSVRYLSKEDEAAAVISSEDIDIAFVCAHQYLELRDGGDVVGVAMPVIAGESTTKSMLVVQAEDPATSIEDLRGSVVGASDKSSLGGLAYLAYLCEKHGAPPQEYFAELHLGDTQESNMRDVLDGEIRATVINSAQAVDWDLSEFKVIETSPAFGMPPVVVNSDMDPELHSRFETLLLEFAAEEVLPNDSRIDGFVALTDSEYAFAEQLRDACGHHSH